jgi:hypothetical protein
VPPREYLIIADAVAPLVASPSAIAATGLGRALAAAGHKTPVLSAASPDVASQVPGLARRLRKVSTVVGAETLELSLYEGRASLSQAELLVLGTPALGRAETAAMFASAVRALGADGLLTAPVTIGWGETAAAALSATASSVRIFALPTGRLGPPLSAAEKQVLAPHLLADDGAQRSLVALGSLAANAILAPSPSAARANESDPALASRASDEPFLGVRFGCDDPPHDPATDPALPVNYSADTLGGKLECRKALARRCSLALGPRTLLLTAGPLYREEGAEALLAGLEGLTPFDVVTVIVPRGDRELVERARLLAIQHPGRIALLPESDPAQERFAHAAADAILLGDDHDQAGRSSGLALLYGTLPIVPNTGANRDYLVDYDQRSATGHAILYGGTMGAVVDGATSFGVEGAVRRALAVRADSDAWSALVRSLFASAPRWSKTAAAVEEIVSEFA